MEGFSNPAFLSDEPGIIDSNANEIHTSCDVTKHYYSTLGHPPRQLVRVERIYHSAPCTLDKKALAKEKQLCGYNAPVFIITEPWEDNHSMLMHRDVTPSPTLRAHELAILATPLVLGLGVQTVNRSNSNSPDSQTHTHSRTLDSMHVCGSNGVQMDSVSLHRLTSERRKLSYQRKKSRRYLVLSVVLGVCAVILLIVIIVTWQMA